MRERCTIIHSLPVRVAKQIRKTCNALLGHAGVALDPIDKLLHRDLLPTLRPVDEEVSLQRHRRRKVKMSYLTLEAIVKSVWEVPHVRAQMTERCAPWGIDEAGTVHHPMQGSLPKAHWREEGFCYIRRVDADGARYVRVDLKATALNQRQTSARDSRHRQRDTPVTELLLTPDGGWSEGIVARDARADEDVVIPLFIDITQDDVHVKRTYESVFCRFMTLCQADWNRFTAHLGTTPAELGIFWLTKKLCAEHGRIICLYDPEANRNVKGKIIITRVLADSPRRADVANHSSRKFDCVYCEAPARPVDSPYAVKVASLKRGVRRGSIKPTAKKPYLEVEAEPSATAEEQPAHSIPLDEMASQTPMCTPSLTQ